VCGSASKGSEAAQRLSKARMPQPYHEAKSPLEETWPSAPAWGLERFLIRPTSQFHKQTMLSWRLNLNLRGRDLWRRFPTRSTSHSHTTYLRGFATCQEKWKAGTESCDRHNKQMGGTAGRRCLVSVRQRGGDLWISTGFRNSKLRTARVSHPDRGFSVLPQVSKRVRIAQSLLLVLYQSLRNCMPRQVAWWREFPQDAA